MCSRPESLHVCDWIVLDNKGNSKKPTSPMHLRFALVRIASWSDVLQKMALYLIFGAIYSNLKTILRVNML